MNITEITIRDKFTIGDFLAPISESHPAGPSLKETDEYSRIQAARAADDATLPRGVWDRDLKQSDWDLVGELCADLLLTKTKDIQLCLWMLESDLYANGVKGFALHILLLAELIDQFWDDIHPLMLDGDIEYRTNLFAWMSAKLPNALRTVQISNPATLEPVEWGDYERALSDKPDDSAVGLSQIRQSISDTEIGFFEEIIEDLSDAYLALEHLEGVLESRFKKKAPRISGLSSIIEEIAEVLMSETSGRLSLEEHTEGKGQGEGFDDHSPDTGFQMGSGSDRQQAYAALAKAANILMRDDPHSPVPYMVFKAIEWGGLSTAELYEELFVKNGGSISIFDLLGVENPKDR